MIMNRTQTVRGIVSAMRERITPAYRELCASTPISLQKLMEPGAFRFDEYCRGFRPHPQMNELKKRAEAFGLEYGIWHAKSPHYVNCGWYLYPGADPDRLFTIIKSLVIGFHLNDVMGRDVFKHLPPEQQQSARQLIKNIAGLDIGPDSSPLERVHAEMLRETKRNAPGDWFDRFLRDYSRHIDITHSDQNADSLGHIPCVDEYIENRCYYAAVHHLVLWIEYSSGEFLDWGETPIYERLKRLHWVAAAFPAFSNDLFSFETEVIDNGCDSNLVTVILLNNPHLSLLEAIEEAGAVIRQLITDILELLHSIKSDIAPASTLLAHLQAIEWFIQACWLWQAQTLRYKRPHSIWVETREGINLEHEEIHHRL